MINNNLIALIQTQRSHIDTLLKIIKHLQFELKLALNTETQPEEKDQIIKELIYWIDQLMEEEK